MHAKLMNSQWPCVLKYSSCNNFHYSFLTENSYEIRRYAFWILTYVCIPVQSYDTKWIRLEWNMEKLKNKDENDDDKCLLAIYSYQVCHR